MSVFILVVCRYICYQQTHRWKRSFKKTLVGNLWTASKPVGNKYTDGFTYGQSMPKKITCFILLVYSSVNIRYHRQNTIYNFVNALTITITFVIILFQLSEIYRRLVLLVTPSIIVVFVVTLFNSLEYNDGVVLSMTLLVIF